ncbi:hypothetical protein CRG98_049417 [Punica granatum]|uniref:Uncharacterized protein n=1 Tax=Punica granatum TaxID=22663 RepID=A0A2I0HET8_PUNGR|nr:hypothetical protein CRG98_049417 [Punica granatum]
MHVRGARCTGRAAGGHGRRGGPRGARLEGTGGAGARGALGWRAREARGRAVGVRGRVGCATVRAGARLCARAGTQGARRARGTCAGALASARLALLTRE